MNKFQLNKFSLTRTITKFTRDTAFKVMFHQYINPPILTIVINTVRKTITAEKNDNPVRKNVTTKITTRDRPIDNSVSDHIVKYCS